MRYSTKIIITIVMAKCCFALWVLRTHFGKCKQSNRKSNKHFNPSHFVCVFIFVIFVCPSLSLCVCLCYLFRWFCTVIQPLNRWQCCTFGQLSKIQANACLLRLSCPGIEALRSHLYIYVWFHLVWFCVVCLFFFARISRCTYGFRNSGARRNEVKCGGDIKVKEKKKKEKI